MLDVLLPRSCVVCGSHAAGLCARCWRDLRPAVPVAAPPGIDQCRAALVYEGAGREVVARLKYRNGRAVVGWLGAAMAHVVADLAPAVDVVTWAPTSAARRRQRGFDQAELLAGRVGRGLGVPVRPLLARPGGPAQTGRARVERVDGVEFVARRSSVAGSPRVLVVDDVVTTGATLSAAARALRNAGATNVAAVVAGRTPLKVFTAAADA